MFSMVFQICFCILPLLITNSNIFVSNIDQMFLLHLYKTVLNTPLKKYEIIQKNFYYCVYVAETKISMRKFFSLQAINSDTK